MNGFTSLLNCAWEWSAEALLLSISAAGSAALLAALVAAINVCGRRWLSARQMGLLWGLVLLRLLVPFAPPGFFSLQNLLISVQSEAGKSVDEVRTADVGYAEPQPNPTPSNDYAASPAPINNAEPGDQFSLLEDWLSLALPFVWVLGAATTLLGTAVVHWRFCQHLKRMPVSNDARLCRLWTSARRLARVRRSLPIVLTDSVDQPAVTGVFRPKLLLPEHATELSDDQLRMIMLHELAHFRRWHVAGNWALVVVRAFHWWNPLYWFAAARFQSLREQACDAFAVQRMEGCPTRSYGELLLTLAGHRQARASWRIVLPVSILGFFSAFFRKHAVRNRIAALRTAGIKRSRLHTAAIGGLIALAAACGLTDAGTPEAPAKPGWDWLSIDAVRDWNDWHGSSEAESGETVVRYYDLGKALRRIAEDEQISDASRMLKWQVIALLGGYEPDRSNPSVANVKRGYEERVVIDGAALKVDAPVVVQAEVERNIRAWEQGGLAQICVETRFITDDHDIASALGISWRYLAACADDRDESISSAGASGAPTVRAKVAVCDYLPITVANLSAGQAHQLVEAAQQGRRTNLLQAPKVTLVNGQRMSVFDRTQTPFVVGVERDRSGVKWPKIDIIDEGIKLILRATQGRDPGSLQLEARVERSEIEEVRKAPTLLDGEPSNIQLPRVKRCFIDICSEVPEGESLLVGCIPSYEQKRFFYVLLTARTLRPLADERE